MSYREQVSQFLKALSQSPDLDAARPVVEANLYLLHSPQFMPAFMATISQPEISDLERFLINLALTEILNTLDPGQLGPETLIVALLFSEEDFSTLVGRYADYIDISACQQMMDLADALGDTRPRNIDSGRFVVAARHGERQVAFMVDRLLGEQDVVVKSLGDLVGNRRGITGATILGDGSLGLIVDTASLVNEQAMLASA